MRMRNDLTKEMLGLERYRRLDESSKTWNLVMTRIQDRRCIMSSYAVSPLAKSLTPSHLHESTAPSHLHVVPKGNPAKSTTLTYEDKTPNATSGDALSSCSLPSRDWATLLDFEGLEKVVFRLPVEWSHVTILRHDSYYQRKRSSQPYTTRLTLAAREYCSRESSLTSAYASSERTSATPYESSRHRHCRHCVPPHPGQQMIMSDSIVCQSVRTP